MDLSFINTVTIPVIVGICAIVGFIIKKWCPEMYHDLIPTFVCVLGLILACIDANINGIPVTLETIFAGMASGLASTGCYEMFTHWYKDDEE